MCTGSHTGRGVIQPAFKNAIDGCRMSVSFRIRLQKCISAKENEWTLKARQESVAPGLGVRIKRQRTEILFF